MRRPESGLQGVRQHGGGGASALEPAGDAVAQGGFVLRVHRPQPVRDGGHQDVVVLPRRDERGEEVREPLFGVLAAADDDADSVCPRRADRGLGHGASRLGERVGGFARDCE